MSIFRKTKIREEGDESRTPLKFSRSKKILSKDPRKLKKRRIKRIVIISVLAIVVLAGGYFGVRAYNALRSIFADGSGILSLFNGDGNTQYLKGESSGRVNVLLLGVGDEGHDGATLTDTIIVASYDTKTKAVAMFSLPRDLYVKIPSNGYAKINAVHAYAEQKKEGSGPDASRETVGSVLDIPIHYYVRMDFSGLAETVDALGGVTVDVENTFCDYAYPTERKGDTAKVCFDKGSQYMNGTKALQYSRSRHALGVEGSDFARSKRQQRLLVAIKNKALSGSTLANPKKLLDLLTALGKHLKTDAQMAEMLRVFELAKGVDESKIISRNFDNSPTGLLVSASGAAGYILEPRTGNFKEIQAVVENVFAIIVMKEEKASIALYNGTWNTGLINKLAASMKEEGYNIATSGNADTKNYTKTKIIDYTDGKKPETVKALEAMFDVKATRETPTTATFDIKIIVGKDYQ
jgi:LCP family protein required for cell wall assembly